jgi:uncharacterized protein (TIGR03000 family)
MYSIVLMTALATGAGGTSWCHRAYCHGAPACSCYGGCSCYGVMPVQGYGAAGGCYGYHGGCYGAFGNLYAGNVYADPYGGGCTGCYGCYGGHSGYGVPLPTFAVPATRPSVTDRPPVKDPFPPKKDGKDPEDIGPLKEKEKKKVEKKLEEEASRVKVRVEVPEGGKLFIDGRAIEVPPGIRVFQTPPLVAGDTFFYDVRIEVEQGGVVRREERRVIIQAGQDAHVSFPGLRLPTASSARVQR